MLALVLRAILPGLLVLLPIVLIGGALLFIYSGIYDVAATRQHSAPVYWALITVLRQSIQAHASREIPDPPELSARSRIEQGFVLYDRHCLTCHGAPGVAPDPLALGLTPPPANLVIAGREWTAQELYWTTANGLKMTGMPAWQFRMTADEMWAIVAFLKYMPALAPIEYKAERARLIPAHQPATGQP